MRQLIVFLTVLLGCASGGNSTVAPSTDNSLQTKETVPTTVRYSVWAYGELAWDEKGQTLAFVPDRSIEKYYDVWSWLTPPKCYNCLTIKDVIFDPVNETLSCNVTLMNPIGLTGWFVRGVVDTPDSSGIRLTNADGWWHSSFQAPDDNPAPFRTFAMEFGPGEIHTVDYQFKCPSPKNFKGTKFSVIVRHPKDPGEITSIAPGNFNGALTKSGGFLTVRCNVEEDNTVPKFQIIHDHPPSWSGSYSPLRCESYISFVGWVYGEPTNADEETIWVSGRIEGNGENYLALEIRTPIQDVVPTPKRVFPTVAESPSVFVDQLKYGMTEAQAEFMATHCVGSQKLTQVIANQLRNYNSDFIVLQYHLAFGSGNISNVYGDQWIKNWEFETGQEDFYEHRSWSTQPNNRVLQVDWNWYLTDPESDWVLYFIGNTLDRMMPIGDQFDGVFADSASQPWNTDPSKWWEGGDSAPDMFLYWTPKTQFFFDTVVQAYHTLPTYYYLIPNAGSYVTTISDITYNQCDGVMIEGFSHWGPDSYFTEEDWRLQLNRTRSLATQNKIILCQSSTDPDNLTERLFILGSYFLLKDNYTYLNICGPWGLEPQWWPEYSWSAGDAVEDWTDISELQDSGGCYARHFSNGIVIVNPSDETRYYTTTQSYSHTIYASGGLLPEDGMPTGVAAGPIVGPGPQELPPHSTWLGVG